VKIKVKAKAVKGATKKKGKDACGLTFCVDPKTGALQIEIDGECPKGYVRQINKAVRTGVILPPED